MTHAGTEITAQLVRDLLRDQFPDLAGRPVSLGARGWDNQLWRLGGDLAARLPWATPRADALLLREYARLPRSRRAFRCHGESRVAKVVLISAVTPYVMAAEGRPDGLPKSVFDDFRAQLAGHRSEFFQGVASGPFYGFNRPGAEPSEPVIQNWVRQAMTGAANAEHDEITAFCEDFTEDLKKITVPVLVMQGEDDQVVTPAPATRAVKLVANGTLKTYPGYPHGMPVTHADVLNPDLLSLIQS